MPAGGPLLRDGTTRLGYAVTSGHASIVYALGPVTALLKHDLHLSYASAALHSTLFALGGVGTGLLLPAAVRRHGRRRVLAVSLGSESVGALALALSPGLAGTLPAALLMGAGGGAVIVVAGAVLSDRHGPRAPQALLEANVIAVALGVLSPLLLGGLAALGTGLWRIGLLFPAIGLGLLVRWTGRVDLPQAQVHDGPVRPLPRAATLAACLVALVVAVEFCILLWSADVMVGRTGLRAATAASALSVFVLALLVGRAFGARLTTHPGRERRLTAAALALAAAGSVLLWFATVTPLALLGLGIAGLGVANLYPLTIAQTLALSGGQTDRAAARAGVIVSGAVVVAPFALGAVADQIGVEAAFGLVPVLVVAAALLQRFVPPVPAGAGPVPRVIAPA